MWVDVGPYRITRLLGQGGFATTYEAMHRALGLRACLKVGSDPRHNDLLLAEARLLWDLHHPSLPTLRDVIPLPDGNLALAMRFVEGIPLEAAAPLDVATATQVLGRLLRALRLIHHRGVVHNDVKPANVIVEPDRHGAVLIDFGVSSLRPRAHSSAVGLTPQFAAPEVAAGEVPRPESDLNSLGLSVLWALGADVERRVLPRGVPDALLDLLLRLTRREAGRRPCWGRDDPMRRLEGIMAGGGCA